MDIKEINEAKAQPLYLRNMADEFDDMEMSSTANDYRKSADIIENLLATLNIPIFK